MDANPWLPKGFVLPDGSRVDALRFYGDHWQIWSTSSGNRLLLACPDLVKKWCDASLIDAAVVAPILFGFQRLECILSPEKFILEPVSIWNAPSAKNEAVSFSHALAHSRRCVPEVSFHDAVFLEQYSSLLPTWTLSGKMADSEVLGKWLSGGVNVSAFSTRRIASLVGWLDHDILSTLLGISGITSGADDYNVTNANMDSLSAPKSDADVDTSRKFFKESFKLPGRPLLEEFFNEHIIDIIRNADKYMMMGIDFPSAVVLHGPPGCGKTFAVGRLAEFLDWPVFSIDSGTIGSPYIHQTSKKIAEVFDKAIQDSPSMIVIDEMEAFLTDRSAGGNSGLHHVEEVAEFLRRIPDATKNRVLIIGMTNMLDTIDPAILRRGRFDHIVEVGMPSREEVAALIMALVNDLPKDGELNIAPTVDALTGRSLSDVSYVIREACRLSARQGKSKIDNETLAVSVGFFHKTSSSASYERRIGFAPR